MPHLDKSIRESLFVRAKKIDDLAFAVLAKSLPEDLAPLISKRILYDYMSDIGAIGILRQLYLEDFDLEKICKLYWRSRREVGNPNFESIMAQLLINVCASFIYDQIKILYDLGIITQKWLTIRDILPNAAFFSPSEFVQVLQHARLMYSLYKLKANDLGTKEASQFVKDTLADQPTLRPQLNAHDVKSFELVLENMRVIARGIVIDSVRDTGHKVKVPPGGLVVRGLPASRGLAWGRPIAARKYMSLKNPIGDFVIAMDSHDLDPDNTVDALYRVVAAITHDNMLGHVPVLARGIGKPCVGSIRWRDQGLSNFSFAVVDGFAGVARFFLERPVGFPELGGTRRFYKREGD
jgi:hypothetical protein